MKHKLNLPEHPNIAFLIIVFDIIALAAVYGLYSTNWVGQAGFNLELAQSEGAPLIISEKSIVVKILPERSAQCIVGNKAILYSELTQELTQAHEEHAINEVLLMFDKGTSVEKEQQVISLVQRIGMQCTLVYESKLSK